MEQSNCVCQEALATLIKEYRGQRGALIPVLQKAQELYGFLPEDVMRQIANGLNIPASQVYGVATFYAQFHLQSRGRNIIRVCEGTACHVRGADKIMAEVQKHLGIKAGETTADRRYTLESVACIGACGLAPVMMVNEDTHGRLTPDKIATLLDRYE